MKRQASLVDIKALNNRSDALFCQQPPRCGFHEEEGYARREFNRLQPQDQERVMKDIYGIEYTVEETPSFAQECLSKLEQELEFYMGKKKGLQMARDEYPAFFEDETFRLQFLRTDNYNPKLSARRLMRHLEKKLELFGPEKLGKKITIEDLDEDDMESLLSGGIQPLFVKDRGGRYVVFSRHKNWKYKNILNMMRSVWYMAMVLAEDPEEANRMKSVVVVSYQNGPFSPDSFDRNSLKKVMDLARMLPVKLAGYHFCFDDIRFRMVWGLATVFIGKDARLRSRDHEGTHVECRYGLMSYGIPVDAMPITIDGVEDNSSFLKWVDEKRSGDHNDPAAASKPS